MEKFKENMKKMQEALDKINEVTEGFNDKLDTIYVDDLFCEMIENMKEDGEEKLTKKQRKEKLLKLMNEKFPNIVKIFEAVEIFSEGVELKVEMLKDKFEGIQDKISEIEDMKEELENKKQELDY